MALELIRPETVDDDVLYASNVAEDEYSAWGSGPTYAAADYSIKAHTIWQSVQDGNTNHDPTTDDGTWWIEVGPTNRWGMFDEVVLTQTTNADSIEVSLQMATGRRLTSVALLNIDAASLQVTMTDDTDGLVYDETVSLISNEGIVDPWSYTYEPIVRRTDIVVSGLPSYAAALLGVNLLDPGNVAKCGVLVVGFALEIGEVQSGARVGLQDYSIKGANDFGETVIIERAYSKTANFTVLIENPRIDHVFNTLAAYRATPIVYSGSTDYGSTVQYGFPKDFGIEVEGLTPGYSLCTLEIEALT